jgi:hypothetical protein
MAKIKLIACEVMHRELMELIRQSGIQVDLETLELGLHLYPAKLHQRLQDAILNVSAEDYDTILLAFGLCGGAAKGLNTGSVPVIMPRVHDCVPVLLGSIQRFNELREKVPGTFYLTRGLLEGEKSILGEYQSYCKKYGETKALKLYRAMYRNYTRLLYVKTTEPEDGASVQKALESAQRLDLSYEETDWDGNYLKQLIAGPWDTELFITVPPHRVLEEEQFGL